MMLRQTFADVIVNAGYGLHPDTVIFYVVPDHSPMPDFTQDVCLPLFDNCFVQVPLGTDITDGDGGVFFGKMNGQVYAQVFSTMPLFKTADGEQLINVHPHIFTLSFAQGLLMDVIPTPVNFMPPSPLFVEMPINENSPIGLFILKLALFAFARLHERAEIELVEASRQVKRQVERKTGKKPSPYFEVRVDTTKPKKRYENSQKTGQKRGAHVVRGHFAFYTEDAPLFGHTTGAIWKPAHVRGATDGAEAKAKNYRIIL